MQILPNALIYGQNCRKLWISETAVFCPGIRMLRFRHTVVLKILSIQTELRNHWYMLQQSPNKVDNKYNMYLVASFERHDKINPLMSLSRQLCPSTIAYLAEYGQLGEKRSIRTSTSSIWSRERKDSRFLGHLQCSKFWILRERCAVSKMWYPVMFWPLLGWLPTKTCQATSCSFHNSCQNFDLRRPRNS